MKKSKNYNTIVLIYKIKAISLILMFLIKQNIQIDNSIN